MKFRNLVVAAAATLFLALTSFAQITAMEGDVKGEDGKPLVGAMIKIVRTDIKGNYNVKTDKKGHFFYNGLPIGQYNVTVEVGGKEIAYHFGSIPHSDPTTNFPVFPFSPVFPGSIGIRSGPRLHLRAMG